jgi:hypothetical protein
MTLHGSEHTHRATSYAGVHAAVIRLRGSAVGKPCHGCGRPATGWMRIGPATHIGRNSHGKRVKWSTDLSAYAWGCSSCNARADHGGSLIYCPAPARHVRAAWGTTAKGECRGCQRERNRARYRREGAPR